MNALSSAAARRIAAAAIALAATVACGSAFAQPAPPTTTPRSAAPSAGRDDADAAPAATRRAPRPRPAARPTLKFGVADVLAEVAVLPDHPVADGTVWLRGKPYVLWQPSRQIELRAGIGLSAVRQSGDRGAAYDDAFATLDDTYVRWRDGGTRLTAGAQTIVWGRVDGIPLIDRVSRVDLSRVVLDDLPQRRTALPVLRWEQDWETIRLDAVLLPGFEGARLPDARSVWNPVDRRRGRIVGLEPSAALAALASTATVTQREYDHGGAALRLTRTGVAPADVGFTAGRTRQSLPTYVADFAGRRLVAVHPLVSFAAVDAEWTAAGATWRTELLATHDTPVTTLLGRRTSAPAVEWVGAVEFFPGGRDTRVNLQLVARDVRADGPVLELTHYTGVNGQIETTMAQGRWKAGLRFASGISVHDVWLSPSISYVGYEPHELTLSVNAFRGDPQTLGGYYRDNTTVAFSLRTSF